MGKVGNDGKLEKLGMSMFEMPKLLICGIENPSKFNKPVNGDCKASLGFSSDDEEDPSDDDDDDEDDDDESGDKEAVDKTGDGIGDGEDS